MRISTSPALSREPGDGIEVRLFVDMELARSEFTGDRLQRLCLDIGQHERCAMRGKLLRNGRAEAVRRAGHQHALAAEIEVFRETHAALRCSTHARVRFAPSASAMRGAKPKSRRAASMASGPIPKVFHAGPSA